MEMSQQRIPGKMMVRRLSDEESTTEVQKSRTPEGSIGANQILLLDIESPFIFAFCVLYIVRET